MKLNKQVNIFSEITEIPEILNQQKYPSLNGLRGISIIIVVIYHMKLKYSGQFAYIGFMGPLGVDIFFVISGFLITTLCIKEKIITNDLSLRKFYLRRILRILPVSYLYILVIAVLNFIFKLHISIVSFFTSVFFLSNLSYFGKMAYDWDLAHYWSLSVEEQFYLIFPVFIKKFFNLFVALIIIVAFGVPLFFFLQTIFSFLNFTLLSSALRYLSKFQGISIGCLFSVLMFKGYLKSGKFNLILTLISIFVIFYLKYNADENLHATTINLVISTFVGFIIVNNIYYRDNFIFRFLNNKLLSWMGILSYSIYIWQQLFLSNDSRFPLSIFPINLVFLFVIPIISYFLYEKFFLRLKTSVKKL